MSFTPLFDTPAQLFYIGWTSRKTPYEGRYDLLSSEARQNNNCHCQGRQSLERMAAAGAFPGGQ
jgi:hypothetical protein